MFDKNKIKEIKEELSKHFMRMLDLIRIYTKDPSSKDVKKTPLIVKRGITIGEVARIIHSQLYKNFKYAKIWRDTFKVKPQRVGKDFILEDGDILEIVTK